jgi:hypothetical protein
MYDSDIPVQQMFQSFYIPTNMIYFSCFFVLFEFSCNIWADISGFADR